MPPRLTAKEKHAIWELETYLFMIDHAHEILLRARCGNTGARQIAVLLHKFRLTIDDQIFDDLLVAIAEYRRALLN
jgi:hypothetical protein